MATALELLHFSTRLISKTKTLPAVNIYTIIHNNPVSFSELAKEATRVFDFQSFGLGPYNLFLLAGFPLSVRITIGKICVFRAGIGAVRGFEQSRPSSTAFVFACFAVLIH